MGRSRIKYSNETADITPDENVTHIRLYHEDSEWWLDGVDDEGNYSERCWSYDTWESAVADIPDFLSTFTHLTKKG